jgi:hypothetical protein
VEEIDHQLKRLGWWKIFDRLKLMRQRAAAESILKTASLLAKSPGVANMGVEEDEKTVHAICNI